MILVIGGTGLIGGLALEALAGEAAPVRALVRDLSRLPAHATNVDARVGDLEQPETIEAALDGVDRVLLVTPATPRMTALQGNLVEVAARRGAIHVVKLSGLATALDSPVRSGRWHAEVEERIREAGLPFTFLHTPYFMQNLLGHAQWVASSDLESPVVHGRIAMTDARDIAAVAARALTHPGHRDRTYLVTGPEALGQADVAERLSRALGRTIRHRAIESSVARERMIAGGAPPWRADVVLDFFAAFERGLGETVTTVVADVTGRPACSLDDFLHDHRERLVAASDT